MLQKLKSFILDDAIFNVLLLVLIGVISFGLGQKSVSESSNYNQSAGIVFTESPFYRAIEEVDKSDFNLNHETIAGNNESTETTSIDFQFVASKNGSKYHLKTCSGAKNIKPENLIYFATREEAEMAGYTKAANCPGL